jgi:hypothetical protein
MAGCQAQDGNLSLMKKQSLLLAATQNQLTTPAPGAYYNFSAGYRIQGGKNIWH